jgi:hypothetical protein
MLAALWKFLETLANLKRNNQIAFFYQAPVYRGLFFIDNSLMN